MKADASPESQKDLRNRSIKGAVYTSILSKFGTLLLRLISIPIAESQLGMAEFGVYTTILVVVQMMDVFHVGIGPALTDKLSKAVLEKDKQKEARLFSTSILISAAISIGIALLVWIVVSNVSITTLFGPKYGMFAETMRRACQLGIIILTVEMICLVAERARDGYMETRYTNSWGAAGNFLGAGLLIIGIWKFPSVEFLILAVNGSVVLAKLGNMVQMMIQRPYLLPSPKTFTPALIKPLLAGAVVFTIVYGTNAIAEYNVIAIMVGRFLGPEQAAHYSILVTLHVSLSGIIAMLTVPLWPAVIDAYERKDFDWVSKAAKRLRLVAVCFGGAVFTGMTFFGPWAMDVWIGDSFQLERIALTIFGAYFALHLWRQVNQILCLGIGQIKQVAVVVIGETICYLTATFLLLKAGEGITFILAAICISLVMFSGWALPMIYRRAFRAGTEQSAAAETPELVGVS